MRSILSITAIVIGLSACAQQQASITRPESLIDLSAERVTFGLSGYTAKDDVINWAKKDQPSRAELTCSSSDATCRGVAIALDGMKVPYGMKDAIAGEPKAVLVYERTVGRACNPRYVDNSFNPENRVYQGMGCAVSANVVQQVSQQSQFTNPATLGNSDGSRAVQSYYKAQRLSR